MKKDLRAILEAEYSNKKRVAIDSLRHLDLNTLLSHIREYKNYYLAIVEENENAIVKSNLFDEVESQLNRLDYLECLLSSDIDKVLTSIMLNEDFLLHLIENTKAQK